MPPRLSLVLGAALLAASFHGHASQDTGTIRGQAAPDEQIIIVSESTNAIVGVVADHEGRFEAHDLAPGQYRVARGSTLSQPRGAPVLAGRVTTVTLPAKADDPGR